uniref:Secreted protein n=1 Tax=Globodera pallida TaxID=36090 RepID=A0A183C1H6_GLOPA
MNRLNALLLVSVMAAVLCCDAEIAGFYLVVNGRSQTRNAAGAFAAADQSPVAENHMHELCKQLLSHYCNNQGPSSSAAEQQRFVRLLPVFVVVVTNIWLCWFKTV